MFRWTLFTASQHVGMGVAGNGVHLNIITRMPRAKIYQASPRLAFIALHVYTERGSLGMRLGTVPPYMYMYVNSLRDIAK